MGETIRRQHLDDYHESAEERVRRQTRSLVSVLIPGLVAGLVWVVGSHVTYLYFAFLVADRPGQLIWRLVSLRRTRAVR